MKPVIIISLPLTVTIVIGRLRMLGFAIDIQPLNDARLPCVPDTLGMPWLLYHSAFRQGRFSAFEGCLLPPGRCHALSPLAPAAQP